MKKRAVNSLLSPLKTQWWLVSEQNKIKNKVIKDFTEACCYLPKPVRKSVFSVLDNFIIFISRFFLIISQVSLTAYIVSGKEKHSNVNIKILFISDKTPSPYILHTLFSVDPIIEKQSNIHIWNCQKKINQIPSKFDAIFIKSDRFYANYFEKQGYKIIPEWISMTLDISGPLDSIYKKFSKGTKEDIKKIKKYGYTYEISQDIDKLELFYNKMYIPYISWKYGKTGVYANFYALKHLFEQGGKLLLIKLDDEYMFGGLYSKKKDKVLATFAGVMEGKYDYIQKGLITASYHYLIQLSKKSGANIIDFGSCKPFVNDGVFIYKRKWGTKIEKTGVESAEIFSFKACNGNKAMKSFLTNNPFIYLEKNQLNTEASEKNI